VEFVNKDTTKIVPLYHKIVVEFRVLGHQYIVNPVNKQSKPQP
jgi:hypothetical protein